MVRFIPFISLSLLLGGTPTCVQVDCANGDLSCNPLAALLYLPTIEPDCMVRGDVPGSGWAFFSGGPAEDGSARAICGLPNGNTILTGTTQESDLLAQGVPALMPYRGSVGSDRNAVLYRVNGFGFIDRWTHFGDNGSSVSGIHIAPTPDGGFYLAAGMTGSGIADLFGLAPLVPYPGGPGNIVLVRYNADLRPQWYRYIGGAAAEDFVSGIAVTDGGGVLMTGSSQAAFTQDGLQPLQAYSGGVDVTIYRIGPGGAMEWFTFFGTATNDSSGELRRVPVEALFSGTSSATERFVTVGSVTADVPAFLGLSPSRAYAGGQDVYLIEFNPNGVFFDYAFYGTAATESGDSILPMRSGEMYLLGSSNAAIAEFDGLAPLDAYIGSRDHWLLHFNGSGALLSHRLIGTPGFDERGSLAETGTGDLLLGVGMGASNNLGVAPLFAHGGGTTDAALLRIASDDSIQTFAYYGGPLSENIQTIAGTSDGGALFGGESSGAGFTPPTGTTLLEAKVGTSADEHYLRVFSDGRVTR